VFFDLEATGLNILQDSLITIQKKDGYGTKVWCIKDYASEAELIEQFVDYYLEVEDKFLIGYNFTNLDLPLLFTRMSKQDIERFFKKYNRGYVRDLAMILEFHKIRRQKLAKTLKLFEIDHSKFKKVDVNKLFSLNNWEKIIEYATNELDLIAKLWNKLWKQIKTKGHLTF